MDITLSQVGGMYLIGLAIMILLHIAIHGLEYPLNILVKTMLYTVIYWLIGSGLLILFGGN